MSFIGVALVVVGLVCLVWGGWQAWIDSAVGRRVRELRGVGRRGPLEEWMEEHANPSGAVWAVVPTAESWSLYAPGPERGPTTSSSPTAPDGVRSEPFATHPADRGDTNDGFDPSRFGRWWERWPPTVGEMRDGWLDEWFEVVTGLIVADALRSSGDEDASNGLSGVARRSIVFVRAGARVGPAQAGPVAHSPGRASQRRAEERSEATCAGPAGPREHTGPRMPYPDRRALPRVGRCGARGPDCTGRGVHTPVHGPSGRVVWRYRCTACQADAELGV